MEIQSICQVMAGIGIAFFVTLSTAGGQELPCVNANSTSTFVSRIITIQLADKREIPFDGTITSVNASTGEVGFKVPGLVGDQVVQPKSIKIAPKPQSMMAQMASPVSKSLGTMNAKYPLNQVSIEDGIVRYPNCIKASPGHEIAFMGTLTFQGNELAVDGEFIDYSFPAGREGPDLSGTGKPGV
jgi:hypothetical protein